MNYFRKSTIQKENTDKTFLVEASKRKKEYKQCLLRQIEEKQEREKQSKLIEAKKESQINQCSNGSFSVKKKAFVGAYPNDFLHIAQNANQLKMHVLQKNDSGIVGVQNLNRCRKNSKEPTKNKDICKKRSFSTKIAESNQESIQHISIEKINNRSNESILAIPKRSMGEKTSLLDKMPFSFKIRDVNQSNIDTSISQNYVLTHKHTNDYSSFVPENSCGKMLKKCKEIVKLMDKNQTCYSFKNSGQNELEIEKSLGEARKTAFHLAIQKSQLEADLLLLKNKLKEIQEEEQTQSSHFEANFLNTLNSIQEQEIIYDYLQLNDENLLQSSSVFIKSPQNSKISEGSTEVFSEKLKKIDQNINDMHILDENKKSKKKTHSEEPGNKKEFQTQAKNL